MPSRSRCASPGTTTPRPGTVGVSAARRPTSTIRPTTSATCTATTSTGCGRGCRSCWSAARASGRTPPARWSRRSGSPGCWPTGASATSSTSGVTTCRTTGRRGAPSGRTTYHGSAESSGGTTMSKVNHVIGMLLGTEDDWPRAFEALVRRLGAVPGEDGQDHTVRTERVTIEPFNLRDKPRHDLVIDRLAYWYYHPREWLKKIALMDDVYLLNSPFTFQSMEKHAAYCAMMRLGLKVPQTVLVPFKNPLDNSRYAYTSARYNQPFDLEALAESVGYPMYMKPYDGGAWVGVSKIRNVAELHAAYDASGERLMHLQAAIEDYDVFARSLTIGPETMVMRFDPDQPMHGRYSVDHQFLDAATGDETVTIGRLVNAFFRWEFNSCETLIRDGVVYPID